MSRTTHRRLLIEKYLKDYPKESTRGIALMLLDDHPQEFETYNAARNSVRYYRGEGTKGSERNHNFMRTEEEKKESRRWRAKSDYEPNLPYYLDNSLNKILVLSDIHIPYHDEHALEVALNWARNKDINTIYLNGDIMDCYQSSRFIKDPTKRSLKSETDMTIDFLQFLKATFPKCEIFYKLGNHELRWEHYLHSQASKMAGFEEFTLPYVLGLKNMGVHVIQDKTMVYAGKLGILHGHEFGRSLFSPVNPARGLYLRAKQSSLIGHHHQTSEHSEKQLDGSVVTTWSQGCLCGLQPDWLPFNKWNHGFARVEFLPDGTYDVENKRIIAGKVT